jgi:hypothetical protein
MINNETNKKRINIRKILNLDDLLNKPYAKVTIELKKDFNLIEIKNIFSNSGDTEINLIFKDKNKRVCYSLEEKRKFDLSHLKALKAKNYVEKIIV